MKREANLRYFRDELRAGLLEEGGKFEVLP